ncbi:putative NBD/HSP70 family sugar kinase/biotin operon repressor [Azospirillum lipoferum]|uniref:ROK family transcriptional regulator n=1 Tax=Azospirillum lipoferum TaxID=193 RepID=A0A5A9GNX2_AZOLI|nr:MULTISPECIES: ROK family transcriptional regulator [Azospirillum]KAA0595294.1 ROK family transcriptional regulator [Azospirillum lipoferum]MCP1611818.1 putative NBD/HSP70 family sugar kinase/biotin operon repressor [Azospirillum lipoferum]MDW5533423.1 ROK family transcriptional regulator [Azospirillum sp. NL1]
MRGGDTTGLRAYNERLVMHALLQAGMLSKAEIARETGLSGQAASVIVNRLLEDGLLVKLDKVRGQVGQPSTPIAPNPEGAYALGVKIGRRSVESILINLLGEELGASRVRYDAPLPEPTIATAIAQASGLLAHLSPAARARVVGLGIAMPDEIHAWSAELGLAPGALDGWRDADICGAFARETGLPVTLYNDAAAACAAEMIAGDAITSRSALYIYLGTFIGGGVVIDGRLYRGEQGNAGAIGSMPTGPTGPGTPPGQLIHSASVFLLERALEAAGIDPSAALSATLPDGAGEKADAIFDAWAETACAELSRGVVSALSVIDFQEVVVDGFLPPSWRDRFTQRLSAAVGCFNRSGLKAAPVMAGSIGPMARVLGAAMLPLKARFSPDTDLLVRSGMARDLV